MKPGTIEWIDFMNEHVFNKLSDRDRRIIWHRQKDVFGIGVNEKTFTEIAEIEGVTNQVIRIAMYKAIRRMSYRLSVIAQGLKNPHIIVKYVPESLMPKHEQETLPMVPKYVYDLGEISVRIHNCLKEANLLLIEDLLEQKASDLLKMPNFGIKSFNELESILAVHDLKLKGGRSSIATIVPGE